VSPGSSREIDPVYQDKRDEDWSDLWQKRSNMPHFTMKLHDLEKSLLKNKAKKFGKLSWKGKRLGKYSLKVK
jgi:hypothetical protein